MVQESMRAWRVRAGAFGSQFWIQALWERLSRVEMWPAMAPAPAREGARAPQELKKCVETRAVGGDHSGGHSGKGSERGQS